MRSKTETIIRCDCGKVAIRLEGKPILSAICHCDDCQRASAELEPLTKRIIAGCCNSPRLAARRQLSLRIYSQADRIQNRDGPVQKIPQRSQRT